MNNQQVAIKFESRKSDAPQVKSDSEHQMDLHHMLTTIAATRGI